ncbi:MAG: T9SS type A sorting domain-containing protein [Candidatus Eisenbacteria bacterium]|nr:T9SS type A sorting domain-containing protein [Candidatus Eisenbacteria bacterium]
MIGVGPESATDDQRLGAVAFDGTNYLVVWEDRRSGSTDLYCARVSPDGEVLDPSGIVISAEQNAQGTPAVAFDGTNYLVVWDDWRFSMNPNIYGARVTTGGEVLDTNAIAVSTAVDGQTNPCIAFDGTNYLVAWEDWRSGTRTPDIYCTRVSPSGSVLDTAGIMVSAADGDQTRPAVAFNGTDYVVVWEDTRSVGRDIYGSRVTTGAAVLDPQGIAVSTSTGSQEYPCIACDDTDCLVVWEDTRAGFLSDVYGGRVSPAGAALDPAGIAFSTAAEDQLRPAVVFVGTSYLVLWEDWRNGGLGDIYGARVNPDGTILEEVGAIVATTTYDCGYVCPAVGYDGDNCLMVWTDYEDEPSDKTDLLAARVSASGSVLEPGVVLISTWARWQESPAVSFDGTYYLAVWVEYDAGLSWLRGRRVSRDGTPADPDIVITSPAVNVLEYPTVACGGGSHLVVWVGEGSLGYGVYGARVDTSGKVLDTEGIAISTLSTDMYLMLPAVAFDGRNYLVVWADEHGANLMDVYGARVDTSGNVLDPGGIPISADTWWEESPTVAFDGTNYLVAWDDDRTGSSRVRAARVDTSGAVLDPGGTLLPVGDEADGLPAVAFDGTNYLVVWERALGDDYHIFAARVDTSCAVLDPDGVPVLTSAGARFFPAVAFDGTNYLAAWSEDVGDSIEVRGARISVTGDVLDPGGMFLGGTVAESDLCTIPRPAIGRGPMCSMLIAYSAFTGPPYCTNRIWGRKWSGPTVVTFASASASAEGGRVTISWEMAVDVSASSFEVWRSESAEGGFLRLSADITEGPDRSFRCVDETALPGRTYWYRVDLTGLTGTESLGPIEVYVGTVPPVCALRHIFPNPFNPVCTIRYDVPSAGRVSLEVYDVAGRVVRVLTDDWKAPGTHVETWDGRNDDGEPLPSGVYVCRLESGGVFAMRKTVLLR